MTNGAIDAANIDALMVGVPEDEAPRMRFILTTLTQTKQGLDTMREVCESRASICPGLALADPDVRLREEEHNRQMWIMWGTGKTVVERIGIPVVLVALTIVMTRVFG
jgi:hypothetical protein